MQQMIFISDLTACSTCLGHHYAHHQELESIIQVVAACRIWYLRSVIIKNISSHCRSDALWLTSFYYANPSFLMGVSFFVYVFLIYNTFFRKATRA